MNLNESINEDAAFELFGELGCAVGLGPHHAPGETAVESGVEHRRESVPA